MAGSNSNVTRLLEPGVFGDAGTISQVVGGASSGGSGSPAATAQLAEQLQQLQSVAQAETETVVANTQAINQNTTQLGQRPGGGSALGAVGGAIEGALGLGSGLSPLLTGIAGLFGGLFGGGGGGESLPTTFLMPPPVNVNAGFNEAAPTRTFGVDYQAGGEPRGSAAGQAGGTQVTVQVQAMDSQSFLDHSDDIAMAVRQAMLQSTVLNDVIREV